MAQPSALDETFHYPPELLSLLVDAIAALCKSKMTVILFFRGAAVPDRLLADLEEQVRRDRDAIRKHEIARTVLERLNAAGESMLVQRREVIKRVTETDSFASCWERDVYRAKGLVAEIRDLVNVKDSFTRMRIERDKERTSHIRAKERELDTAMTARLQRKAVRRELGRLFSSDDPQSRGRELETVMNRLFSLDGLLVREAFTRSGLDSEGVIEQIDGVIELDGHLYLVEMKWHQDAIGPGDLAQHLVRVFGRGEMRGICISASGFTDAAYKQCVESLTHRVTILCELREFVLALEEQADVRSFLASKVSAALIDKEPLYRAASRY